MELRRYLRILLRRWLVIIVTVIVALAVGFAVTPHGATTYSSSATVLVGPRAYTSGPGGGNLPSSDQANGINSLVLTYTHLVDTVPVAEAAIAATRVPRTVAQAVAETSATSLQFTQLITVTVTDPSPLVAQLLATGMADAFVARIGVPPASSASGSGTATQPGASPAITLQSFGPAGPASASVPSGRKRDLAVAGIFGLLVAIGLCVLAEYLDVTVKDPAEAERHLGAPLLATIPAWPGGGPGAALRPERAPAPAEIS